MLSTPRPVCVRLGLHSSLNGLPQIDSPPEKQHTKPHLHFSEHPLAGSLGSSEESKILFGPLSCYISSQHPTNSALVTGSPPVVQLFIQLKRASCSSNTDNEPTSFDRTQDSNFEDPPSKRQTKTYLFLFRLGHRLESVKTDKTQS